MPYDLFIGIPVHRVPAVVTRSGLAPDGWVPVDQTNPVILYQDDWSGDWLGEYAVLLAKSGGPSARSG